MPSHSKKQHNFMEAIAHSPSFAKKVHIPQSVGKDYVAADKGKTFKHGGDMKKGYADGGMPMVNKGGKMVPSFAADGVGKMAKGGMAESKKMIGKEVAFMKKKGAPAKMIKHEMSEMKGMKAGGRVRRMAAGGTGDPFELSDEDRANYEKNGAENLKRLKGFFGFGNKEEKEAPVPRPSLDPSLLKFNKEQTAATPAASTSRVSSQSPRTRRESENTSYSDSIERDDAASMDKTAKGPQFTSSIAKDEGEYSFPSFKPENRPSQDKEPARPRKPTTVSRTRETTSVTAAPSKGKAPAKINSEKLLRDAEEEVLRKKPTAMTEQMRKAPTINDLYRGQKSMGDEIGDVLKSFRETIRGGLQKGKERQESKGSTMYAKGGNVKRMRYGGEPGMDMGQPMRGTPMGSPQMPMEDIERRKAKMAGMPGMMGAAAAEKMRARAGMGMAEGGYAKADGAASRGKTQPKMVKMAKGGFVKNADGCAQRGRTKAFQVKMKNGGMC